MDSTSLAVAPIYAIVVDSLYWVLGGQMHGVPEIEEHGNVSSRVALASDAMKRTRTSIILVCLSGRKRLRDYVWELQVLKQFWCNGGKRMLDDDRFYIGRSVRKTSMLILFELAQSYCRRCTMLMPAYRSSVIRILVWLYLLDLWYKNYELVVRR